jgi:hypothetical protein
VAGWPKTTTIATAFPVSRRGGMKILYVSVTEEAQKRQTAKIDGVANEF